MQSLRVTQCMWPVAEVNQKNVYRFRKQRKEAAWQRGTTVAPASAGDSYSITLQIQGYVARSQCPSARYSKYAKFLGEKSAAHLSSSAHLKSLTMNLNRQVQRHGVDQVQSMQVLYVASAVHKSGGGKESGNILLVWCESTLRMSGLCNLNKKYTPLLTHHSNFRSDHCQEQAMEILQMGTHNT